MGFFYIILVQGPTADLLRRESIRAKSPLWICVKHATGLDTHWSLQTASVIDGRVYQLRLNLISVTETKIQLLNLIEIYLPWVEMEVWSLTGLCYRCCSRKSSGKTGFLYLPASPNWFITFIPLVSRWFLLLQSSICVSDKNREEKKVTCATWGHPFLIRKTMASLETPLHRLLLISLGPEHARTCL